MTTFLKRTRLTPFYIGVAILAIFETYVGLKLVDEGAAEFAQQAVLVAVPALYLSLMYLALTSQD